MAEGAEAEYQGTRHRKVSHWILHFVLHSSPVVTLSRILTTVKMCRVSRNVYLYSSTPASIVPWLEHSSRHPLAISRIVRVDSTF